MRKRRTPVQCELAVKVGMFVYIARHYHWQGPELKALLEHFGNTYQDWYDKYGRPTTCCMYMPEGTEQFNLELLSLLTHKFAWQWLNFDPEYLKRYDRKRLTKSYWFPGGTVKFNEKQLDAIVDFALSDKETIEDLVETLNQLEDANAGQPREAAFSPL